MKTEHELWVQDHPYTLDDVMELVRKVSKQIPRARLSGVQVPELILADPADRRGQAMDLLAWSELFAYRLEKFVKDDCGHLCGLYADLHVCMWELDRLLEDS